jgi:hypothetical protein
MKRKLQVMGTGLVVLLVLSGGLLVWRHAGQTASAAAGNAEADRALVETVLNSPEQFDTTASTAGPAPFEPLTIPATRPLQLSEVEKTEPVKAVQKPVSAESLYFWKDYASLRKDEIRDPNSEANRQGVVSLLQARQRRAKQENL